MQENVRHGKLVTIRKVQRSQKKPYRPAKWLCKCDCGNEKILHECNLYGIGIKSCGCLEYITKRTFDRKDYKELMQEKIKKKTTIDAKGCWIWKGSKHRQGYGNIRFNQKYGLAHRVAWEVFKGKIPEDLKVCHKCDVTSCCNPDHLFLGSQKENVQDGIVKGRYSHRKIGKRRNKLCFSQVQEIKMLSENGMSRKELEKKFSVGQTCIHKILSGTSWKINWDKEG